MSISGFYIYYMSTRSMIGKLNKDGSVTAIYCHFDGHPEDIGATLQMYYYNARLINKLLKLGDLSSLGEYIEDSETIAYHRDQGGDLDISTYKSEKQYMKKNHGWVSYIYLWKKRQWYVDNVPLKQWYIDEEARQEAELWGEAE